VHGQSEHVEHDRWIDPFDEFDLAELLGEDEPELAVEGLLVAGHQGHQFLGRRPGARRESHRQVEGGEEGVLTSGDFGGDPAEPDGEFRGIGHADRDSLAVKKRLATAARLTQRP
jgi:hypothetical protein